MKSTDLVLNQSDKQEGGPNGISESSYMIPPSSDALRISTMKKRSTTSDLKLSGTKSTAPKLSSTPLNAQYLSMPFFKPPAVELKTSEVENKESTFSEIEKPLTTSTNTLITSRSLNTSKLYGADPDTTTFSHGKLNEEIMTAKITTHVSQEADKLLNLFEESDELPSSPVLPDDIGL